MGQYPDCYHLSREMLIILMKCR